MTMDLVEVMENLGNTAIFSGTAIVIISYFINRKFKAYEIEIQNSAEQFKNKLELSLETHKKALKELYYKSSKLHDKRLEVISNLYGDLVDLDVAMNGMTSLFKIVSADTKQAEKEERSRIEKTGEFYNKYQEDYSKNKIYFSPKTCLLLDKLKTDYWDSYWDYTYTRRFGEGDFQFNYELAKKASEKVQKDIPPVLIQLEDDFRKIINVEDE